MKTDGVTYGLNILYPRSQILHPSDDVVQSAGSLDIEVQGIRGGSDLSGDRTYEELFSLPSSSHIVTDLEPWIGAIERRVSPQSIVLSSDREMPHQRGKITLSGSEALGMAHLRIVAESHTNATLSLETDGHPSVVLIDLLLQDRAQLSLVSQIANATTSDDKHVVIIRAIVNSGSSLDLTTACLGSTYQYHRQAVLIKGEQAHATSRTIVMGSDSDRHDVATEMIHAAPHTRSSQQSRTLLSDRAKAIVRGGITISEGMPGANADLESRALLLSSETEADLVPALVVGTDDVQCRHRASVSSPSDDELFYLYSRGIGHETATHIMTTGFVSPLITSPGGTCVAPELETLLRDRLMQMTHENHHE